MSSKKKKKPVVESSSSEEDGEMTTGQESDSSQSGDEVDEPMQGQVGQEPQLDYEEEEEVAPEEPGAPAAGGAFEGYAEEPEIQVLDEDEEIAELLNRSVSPIQEDIPEDEILYPEGHMEVDEACQPGTAPEPVDTHAPESAPVPSLVPPFVQGRGWSVNPPQPPGPSQNIPISFGSISTGVARGRVVYPPSAPVGNTSC